MDREFECKKCTSKSVDINYEELKTDAGTYGEYLACQCKVCGYSWKEEPSDKP